MWISDESDLGPAEINTNIDSVGKAATCSSNHHCPVCKKQAGHRCISLRHFVLCPIHRDYHNPRAGCVKCNAKAKRNPKSDKKDDKSDGNMADDEGKGNNNNNNNKGNGNGGNKRKKGGGKGKKK